MEGKAESVSSSVKVGQPTYGSLPALQLQLSVIDFLLPCFEAGLRLGSTTQIKDILPSCFLEPLDVMDVF